MLDRRWLGKATHLDGLQPPPFIAGVSWGFQQHRYPVAHYYHEVTSAASFASKSLVLCNNILVAFARIMNVFWLRYNFYNCSNSWANLRLTDSPFSDWSLVILNSLRPLFDIMSLDSEHGPLAGTERIVVASDVLESFLTLSENYDITYPIRWVSLSCSSQNSKLLKLALVVEIALNRVSAMFVLALSRSSTNPSLHQLRNEFYFSTRGVRLINWTSLPRLVFMRSSWLYFLTSKRNSRR